MIILLTGRVFIWGKWTNTYIVKDDDDNAATCSFDIYVRCKNILIFILVKFRMYYFSRNHKCMCNYVKPRIEILVEACS